MAGDPIYDTTTKITKTGDWLSTTEPTCTDTDVYPENNYYGTTTYTSYITYTSTERKSETEKEYKERLKQENITYQISLWNEYVKPLQVKPVRPSIRLRGVSFNGRGWA